MKRLPFLILAAVWMLSGCGPETDNLQPLEVVAVAGDSAYLLLVEDNLDGTGTVVYRELLGGADVVTNDYDPWNNYENAPVPNLPNEPRLITSSNAPVHLLEVPLPGYRLKLGGPQLVPNNTGSYDDWDNYENAPEPGLPDDSRRPQEAR